MDVDHWRRCSPLKPLFAGILRNNGGYSTDDATENSEHELQRSSLERRATQHSCRTFSARTFYDSGLRLILLVSIIMFCFPLPAAGCSSRSTPKPRPPPPSPSPMPSVRPNITFQTYACPPAYATYFCLNGATCFTIKIGESILYNCECTEGYMGQRCEYKDLEGTYLPSIAREKILLERASIAGGATMAIILVVIISIIFYTYAHQRKKEQSLSGFVHVTVGSRKPQFVAACHFSGSCDCHQKKGYPIFYDEHHPLTQDTSDGVSKLIEVDVRYTYADCPVRQSFHLRNINQQLFNNKMDNEEMKRQTEEHADILHQKGNCKDQVLLSIN